MFDFKIVFYSSFGQIAAVDEKAFISAHILTQDINDSFLPGQTARLFFMSPTEFDIARERAYKDQAKISLLGLTGNREKQR